MDEEKKEAVVIVPNDQLSLAIGKSGQNVRLAAKLTNWKIDILSEDEYKNKEEEISKILEQKMKEKIAKDKASLEEEENNKKSKKSKTAKVKVKDLAKELNITAKELIEKAKKAGITLKSSASTITDDQINILKGKNK